MASGKAGCRIQVYGRYAKKFVRSSLNSSDQMMCWSDFLIFFLCFYNFFSHKNIRLNIRDNESHGNFCPCFSRIECNSLYIDKYRH